MLRGPLATAAALSAAVAVTPASAATTQFQRVTIDVGALRIPAETDVALTWKGTVDPSEIECRTQDSGTNAGLLTTVTAACWSTQSQTITVTVTYGAQTAAAQLNFTSPQPYGSARDYRLMRTPTGQPLRFQRCVRIPVRLNVGTNPRNPELEFATRFAVEQVATASGLRLFYKGRTNFMPKRGTEPSRGGIWIGYAYPGTGRGRSNLLTRGNPGELGIGGPYYSGHTIVSGQLVLSRRNLARYGGTALLVETIMHELAHTVGLDHSSARGGQVMAPVTSGKPNVTWGRGDLRGLKKLGPGRACSQQLRTD